MGQPHLLSWQRAPGDLFGAAAEATCSSVIEVSDCSSATKNWDVLHFESVSMLNKVDLLKLPEK